MQHDGQEDGSTDVETQTEKHGGRVLATCMAAAPPHYPPLHCTVQPRCVNNARVFKQRIQHRSTRCKGALQSIGCYVVNTGSLQHGCDITAAGGSRWVYSRRSPP